jgi:DNA-binding Lrp family transcriptional regulator
MKALCYSYSFIDNFYIIKYIFDVIIIYNRIALFVLTMSARAADKSVSALSDIDRKILKILLVPDGNIKSETISTKLGIPLSTIRRRRKRLESEFLKTYHVLDIEKFGWRRVDFFISIKNGKANTVANQLIELDEVTYVGKSIGAHTIDLRVEAIVKDNIRLLDLLEEIKGMDGVNDVVWSEIVSVVGRKISIPSSIIDKI